LLKYKIFTYSSQASFYVSESSASSGTGQNQEFRLPEQLQPNEQFNRAYQLIHSSKVYDHLIRKFNLLKHYEIDTTREFYYEEAISIISSRIQVKKSPFNLISVSVSDKHRYLAADMANEIVKYLDQLNKNLIISSMTQKIEVYNALLTSMQKENAQRNDTFHKQVESLNRVLFELDKHRVNSAAIFETQSQLGQLISSLQRSTEDLLKLKVFYSLALESVKEKNLPTVIVVQTARPGSRSLGWQSIMISAMVMFLILTGIIYSNYLKLRYQNYFHVFMSNKRTRGEYHLKQKEQI
jgi:hypothetical protein